MTGRHSFESLRKGMSMESQARAERLAAELLQEMNLAQLRRAVQFSQEELAGKLGITQASVAKIEKRTDMFISTLRRFVRAMGGELEIAAIFGKERVLIDQFYTLSPDRLSVASSAIVRDDIAVLFGRTHRGEIPVRTCIFGQTNASTHVPLSVAGSQSRNIYQQAPVERQIYDEAVA